MVTKTVVSPDLFKLTLFAYCGMPVPICEGDREDCRSAAARLLIRRRAEGFPVWVGEAGTSWEIGEPENSVMVSDQSGTLSLRPVRVPAYSCAYCGELIAEGESCDCQNCAWCACGDCGGACQDEEEE